jgi:ribosomal protein S17
MANRKIEKKTWPELFEKILTGEKTFDARLADFKIKKGDILVLREWDPKKKKYTGRTIEKKVTYVLKTKDASFWNKKDLNKYGIQIISFKN